MERLRGLDSAFLYLETPTNHLHVAWAAVLDTSERPEAGSPEAMADLVDRRIHRLPALRRQLADAQLHFVQPDWIDVAVDARAHIRVHRSERLEPVAEQVLAQPLDRRRPLWELHLVHGLPEGRTGLVMKMHHALLDGPSGAELMVQLLDLEPDASPERPADPLRVDPAPSRAALARRARRRLGRAPSRAADELRRYSDVRVARQSWDLRHPRESAPAALTAPRTLFNAPISAARVVRFTGAPLDAIDEFRRGSGVRGATVNDVVLSVCGGALRRYLRHHGGVPAATLQAMVPVSVPVAAGRTAGNSTSSITTVLGTNLADPLERLAEVHRVTDIAKRRHDETGSSGLLGLTDLVPPRPAQGLTRLASRLRLSSWLPVAFNAVISNIPGPDTPFYCNGAVVETAFPMGPITDWAALNITVVSYRRYLAFGIVSCPDVVSDVDRLVDAFDAELATLQPAFSAH